MEENINELLACGINSKSIVKSRKPFILRTTQELIILLDLQYESYKEISKKMPVRTQSVQASLINSMRQVSLELASRN